MLNMLVCDEQEESGVTVEGDRSSRVWASSPLEHNGSRRSCRLLRRILSGRAREWDVSSDGVDLSLRVEVDLRLVVWSERMLAWICLGGHLWLLISHGKLQLLLVSFGAGHRRRIFILSKHKI